MITQEIQDKLMELSNQSSFPSVSILLPIQPEGTSTYDNAAHKLKILIQETHRKLNELAADEEAMQQIRQRLANVANTIDLNGNNAGLGIFVSPERQEIVPLPFPVEQSVHVGDSFQIRDLLHARSRLQEYVALLISEKKVLSLRGAGMWLSVVEIPDMPADMADTGVAGAALDTDEIVTDQVDTSVEPDSPSLDGRAEQTSAPNQSATQGVRNDEKTRHFMVRIDQALSNYLTEENLRVVLIGTDSRLGHFKKFSKHVDKIIGVVTGNYDFAPSQTIGELTWPVVQEKLREEKHALLQELEEAVGRQLYVSGIPQVWRAAVEGRIRTLLVEENYKQRALLQDDGYTLDMEVPDEYAGTAQVKEDAVDDLMEIVLSKAGNVVFVEDGQLANHQHLAAITRY